MRPFMRPVRLAQIAAQAEALRYRRRAQKIVVQIACAVVAVPFLLATLGFFEVAFWSYVARHFFVDEAALIVAGGNLLVAVLLVGFAALRGGEDKVTLEAMDVRRRALLDARESVSYAALIGPITAFLLGQLRRPRRD